MKAWQYVGAGQPLTLNEVEEPAAGPGQVQIGVKAVGLCHTDVGILDGVVPDAFLATVPLTLGHEVSGVVTAIGEGVTRFAVGDRVGLVAGEQGPEFAFHGGYAATVAAPEDNVVALPDAVGFPEAAAGTDAGMTSYRAIATVGEVKAGDRVGIIGLGGLGLIGVQIAAARSATVYGAEIRTEIHAVAKEHGVTEVVQDADDLAQFELDVIVDFAGFGTTTAAAIRAIRPGGKVVMVGAGAAETTFETSTFIAKNVRMEGSNAGTAEDLTAFLDLVADGAVTPVLSLTDFDGIKDGLDQVNAGKVTGRLVAVLDEA